MGTPVAELNLGDPALRALLAKVMHDAEPLGWLYIADVALDTLRHAAGLDAGKPPAGQDRPVTIGDIIPVLDKAIPHLRPAYLDAIAADDGSVTGADLRQLAVFLRGFAAELNGVAQSAEIRAEGMG